MLLWGLCGVTWWSWAHFMTVFIPGNLWLAGGPAIVTGASLGALAYLRFITDFRGGLPLRVAYIRVNLLVLVLGAIAGSFLGWVDALLGSTAGLGSTLHTAPPTMGARFANAAACGILGLLAGSGMMFVLGKFGRRPGRLLAGLVGALVLLYVVLPALFMLVMASSTQ